MNKLFFAVALGAAIASTEGGAQPQGGGGQQDFNRQQAQQFADSAFQRLDLNHDGVVTRDEAEQARAQMGGRGGHMIERTFGTAQSLTLAQFEASALAQFDAEDVNHDGVVSAAERQQAHAQRAAAQGLKGERGQ
jgi:hypothetical protein